MAHGMRHRWHGCGSRQGVNGPARVRRSVTTPVTQAVILAGGWLLAALSWAQIPPAEPIIIPQRLQTEMQNAIQKYAEEDFSAAFVAFSELLKQIPANPEINFGLGMAAVAVHKLSHAALAFERVIALQPENDRARLELARTYAAMGQFELADAFFQQVLDRNPPPAVKQNIERYLAEVSKAMRRWQVAGGISAGVLYDDNINIGPAGRRIDIVPTQIGLSVFDVLEVGEESRPKDDVGLFYSASAGILYDPGIRGQWMVQGGTTFYQTRLQEQSDFEVTYVRGYGGLRHSGSKHLLDGRLYADFLQRGGEDFATIFGLAPSLIQASSDRLHWNSQGTLEVRDYADADGLDAVFLEAGQGATLYGSDDQGSVSLSLAGIYNRADEAAFTYAGARVETGFSTSLPLSLQLHGRGAYRYSRYDEAEILAKDPRRDHTLDFELRLERPITKRLTLSARYQHTDNDSSFGLYEYQRNVFTLATDYAL